MKRKNYIKKWKEKCEKNYRSLWKCSKGSQNKPYICHWWSWHLEGHVRFWQNHNLFFNYMHILKSPEWIKYLKGFTEAHSMSKNTTKTFIPRLHFSDWLDYILPHKSYSCNLQLKNKWWVKGREDKPKHIQVKAFKMLKEAKQKQKNRTRMSCVNKDHSFLLLINAINILGTFCYIF